MSEYRTSSRNHGEKFLEGLLSTVQYCAVQREPWPARLARVCALGRGTVVRAVIGQAGWGRMSGRPTAHAL